MLAPRSFAYMHQMHYSVTPLTYVPLPALSFWVGNEERCQTKEWAALASHEGF